MHEGARRDVSEWLSAAPAETFPTPEGKTWNRVVVVSNRLPYKVVTGQNGEATVLKSAGGLVTAMSPLLHEGIGGKWIGWPGGVGEEGLEEALRSKANGPFDVGVVGLTPKEEKEYYEGYSNEVLGPLLIGEVARMDLEKAKAYWPTYKSVQRKFAEKIVADLRSGDIIWVQDYHLMGVGSELKDLGINQPIGYFLHTAFPNKEEFEQLPQHEELLRDLLSYDILGFQTKAFRSHFFNAIQTAIPEAVIEDPEETISTIRYAGRTIRTGVFPISIDPHEFMRQAEAEDTQRNIKRIEGALERSGAQMIFNIGRLDYTKGFYEELLAFDRMLEQHPELVGKVILYQLVVPSRESMDAYKEYKVLITDLARNINKKYKGAIIEDVVTDNETYPGRPVRQVHSSMGRSRYIAHVNTADIQSIPTLSDGMNLVAKESAVVGNSTTVQILGNAAGAAEQLGEYVLLVDPTDTQAFADRLYQAYTMADSEKRERKEQMKQNVLENNVFTWWSKDQEPAFQEVWNERTQ